MKRTILFFSVIILFTNSIFGGVEYKNGSFIVTSPHLKQPLVIGSEKSPVFLETKQGKVYLKDMPATMRKANKDLTAEWSFDGGKKITISFINEKNLYRDRNLYRDHDLYNIELKAAGYKDVVQWGFSVEADANEYFTGLMERVVDGNQVLGWEPGITAAMDLRGQTVTMLVKPTVSLYCPFYISSRNYSLFVEGTWPGTYDFCKTEPNLIKITYEGPEVFMILNTAKGPLNL